MYQRTSNQSFSSVALLLFERWLLWYRWTLERPSVYRRPQRACMNNDETCRLKNDMCRIIRLYVLMYKYAIWYTFNVLLWHNILVFYITTVNASATGLHHRECLVFLSPSVFKTEECLTCWTKCLVVRVKCDLAFEFNALVFNCKLILEVKQRPKMIFFKENDKNNNNSV